MKYIFSLILFYSSAITLLAQGPVVGSGKMITKKVSIEMFSELEVTFPAHIEVNCQTHPNLEITVDDNMFKEIDIINRGNRLIIEAKNWIDPSPNCKIIVGTPFLNRLKTGSYGDYSVFNIQTSTFKLENQVAKVELSGNTQDLIIDNGTGEVDALALKAQNVTVTTWDWSVVSISAQKNLIANTVGDGYILYDKLPPIVEQNLEGGGKLIPIDEYIDPFIGIETEFIDVKVINEGNKKEDIYIIGPPWQTFSYGVPLPKGQVREARVPIGTRVYQETTPYPKLLFEVKPEHANQLIKLFDRGEWN